MTLTFIEALKDGNADGKPARRFRARLIQAGMSGNGNFYSEDVLREAVALFDRARVYVRSDSDHLNGVKPDVRELVGQVSEARWVEGAGGAPGEIQGVLDVLASAGDTAARLTEAVERGMSDLMGLSIVAYGDTKVGMINGRRARICKKITRVGSVDLVAQPAAGGGVISFIEAQDEAGGQDMVLRDRLIAKVKAARPKLQGVDDMTDEDLVKALAEKPADTPADTSTDTPADTSADVERVAEAAWGRVERKIALREAVGNSGLPAPAQERVTRLVEARGAWTDADVGEAIADERAYISRFAESGRVVGLGGSGIEVGPGLREKTADRLDAFFDPEHKDHRHAQSFREAYVMMTGDQRITGRLDACDQDVLREAIGTDTFGYALGNAITRRMLADYRRPDHTTIWRLAVDVVSLTDFRTQERVRVGGYGDVPIVLQGQPYLPMTTPGDEEATYAAAKRGGTEEVTWEAIKNDDVGAIRRVPTSLSRSAKRTVAKFVLDMVRTNPTIYDGKALFHADHSNLGTSALASATYAAGRLAMLEQTELGSGERLGVGPKTLFVPFDLEETAHNLFARSTNLDKTFIQTLVPTIAPVWYWADANNWFLAADPLDMPTIEVGFLDGQEEPALFVQDNPTAGSLFSHDKITYKIRHVYGGAVVDYRGFYGAIVP